jgi:site-specific recombinase XerD
MTPLALYLATLSETSQHTQLSSLRSFLAEWGAEPKDPAKHPWHRWTAEHVTSASAWLAQNRAPATAARVWAAVRQILRQCYRSKLLERDAYDRLVMIRGPVVGRVKSERVERVPTTAEIRALFVACSEQPEPLASRNAALLALAYGCGLRRRELADATLGDLPTAESAMPLLSVTGKGGKPRLVAVPSGAHAAIKSYLFQRLHHLGPNWNASRTLLLATDARGSVLLPSGLSYAAIDGAIAGICAAASVPRFSAHDLRRAYCSELLSAGADISTVQRLMGHANISTTSLYDKRGERALVATADLLVVPFKLRERAQSLPEPPQVPLLPASGAPRVES